MTSTVRTIIVDDHALVGAGLEAVLHERSGGRFEVVGTATRAQDVGALAVDNKADLALVDVHMPPPGGVGAIRAILDASPDTKVVALSGEPRTTSIVEALAAGAVAFLPKTLGPEGLVAPLTTVVEGGAVLPVPLMSRFAQLWLQYGAPEQGPELEERDKQLLSLVCQGLELSTIADRMHISASTVKRRLAALETALGTSSRVESAYRAGWLRLVRPDQLIGESAANA